MGHSKKNYIFTKNCTHVWKNSHNLISWMLLWSSCHVTSFTLRAVWAWTAAQASCCPHIQVQCTPKCLLWWCRFYIMYIYKCGLLLFPHTNSCSAQKLLWIRSGLMISQTGVFQSRERRSAGLHTIWSEVWHMTSFFSLLWTSICIPLFSSGSTWSVDQHFAAISMCKKLCNDQFQSTVSS